MTERLHFHFSLSSTGEGNGNPLQCSCLENSRDGGAWLKKKKKRKRLFNIIIEYTHDTVAQANLVLPSVYETYYASLIQQGEGNGSPLQCSCLENSRDGGAWLKKRKKERDYLI